MTEQTDDAAGFMLTELLVALAILALVSVFAFRALAGAAGWLDRGRHTAAAISIAQSTLDRVGNDIPLDESHIVGQTTDGYTWQVDIGPYEAEPIAAFVTVVPRLVKVTVGWTAVGIPRQVHLTSLRLAYRE